MILSLCCPWKEAFSGTRELQKNFFKPCQSLKNFLYDSSSLSHYQRCIFAVLTFLTIKPYICESKYIDSNSLGFFLNTWYRNLERCQNLSCLSFLRLIEYQIVQFIDYQLISYHSLIFSELKSRDESYGVLNTSPYKSSKRKVVIDLISKAFSYD